MNLSELRQYILLIAGRLAKWSTVDSLTSEFGGLFATMPAATDSSGQSTTQPARNMVGFGFRSAPVAGSECIVAAPRGGAVNAAVVATDHLGYGPTDLAEGDAVVYSKAHHGDDLCAVRVEAAGKITIRSKGGAIVVLDENGKITIDARAGQDVVVNGGTKRVARVDDGTDTGTLAAVDSLGFPVTFTYTDGHGTPSIAQTIDLLGVIVSGADRFKA